MPTVRGQTGQNLTDSGRCSHARFGLERYAARATSFSIGLDPINLGDPDIDDRVHVHHDGIAEAPLSSTYFSLCGVILVP
jgi:hypothetical protein